MDATQFLINFQNKNDIKLKLLYFITFKAATMYS